MPAAPQPGLPQRLVAFYQDVTAEMRKVTWPDRPQVQQLSIGVVVLSLFVGLVIFLLDTVLRLILVSGIPRLF
ncbi:MAG: preprotein translocase subunit SecE [Gemmatimonadetes bacterium]|nr:preprotein translocase subunit SecE [Gemmatimonadota bacterium]